MPSDSPDFLDSDAGFPRPRHALRNLAMLSPLLVMIPGAVLLFMRHDREPDKEAEVRARSLQVAQAIWASENAVEEEEEQVIPPAELIPTNGNRTPEVTIAAPAVETPKPAEVAKAPEPQVEAEKPVIVIGTLPPKPAPTPKKPADRHLVRKGETLYSISKLYGKTPDQLASYNRIEAKDAIKEGQYLRLTPASKTAPLPAPVPVAPDKFMNLTPVSGQSANLPKAEDIKPLPMYCIEYLVQKNDTLESIAAAHATSAQTITVLNGTPAVTAGQTIVVPVDEILGRVR